MNTYYNEYPGEAYDLLRTLSAIPAPSGQEDQRVDFCLKWLSQNGVRNAFADKAKNVIIRFGDSGTNPLVVFSAHSDVVFPDLTPLPFHDDGEKLHCPGISDNSVHVAALLWAAKLLSENAAHTSDENETGLLLVINSCEEGLGNLKGTRHLISDYGHRIKAFIAFDSIYEEIVTIPIGSLRYKINVATEGGHSFRDFGNDNAIAILSGIISELYSLSLPEKGKTTFNVGTVKGGTSVNTIAQSAEMLFEFRSDDRDSLSVMDEKLREILTRTRKGFMKDSGKEVSSADIQSADHEKKHTSHLPRISCDLIGERPCMGDVDMEKQKKLTALAAHYLRKHYPEEPVFSRGSTDCNIPLSKGIPSVCLGCCRGKGAHTREEYLLKDSLAPGLNLALDFIFHAGKLIL